MQLGVGGTHLLKADHASLGGYKPFKSTTLGGSPNPIDIGSHDAQHAVMKPLTCHICRDTPADASTSRTLTTPERPVGHATDGIVVFSSLGNLAVQRARWVLAIALVVMATAGVIGPGVISQLQSQGYTDPNAASTRVADLLEEEFGAETPFLTLIIDSDAPVDSPGVASRAGELVAQLQAEPEVDRVVSYWTSGNLSALRSDDGRAGLILLYSNELSEATFDAVGSRFIDRYEDLSDDIRVHVGGWAAISSAVNTNIKEDLIQAELIAVPVTLVLLLLVFGTVVAAGLPLLVGGLAILVSMVALSGFTQITDVSVFALNLVTGLGLGLGIDYALLVINRFREELGRGADTATAVRRTVATAGRTVVVSGLTVATTLIALAFYPMYFLRSFAYGGVAVVLLAVAATVILLPAVLMLLGPRINAWRVTRRDLTPRDEGIWASIARQVMRRPWPVLLVVVPLLLALAWPALHARFGLVDERVLPRTDSAAVASALLQDRFAGNESSPVEILVPAAASDTADDLAQEIAALPDVVRVLTADSVVVDGAVVAPNPLPQGYTAAEWKRITVISDVAPRSPEGRTLVEDIAAVGLPEGSLIGGVAAGYTDSQTAITSRLPVTIGWIAIVTMLLLFLYTGSVLLPIKAVLMNALSLSATLGLIVLIFQDGHLGWLVGDFVQTGTIDMSTIVIIAVVAFGLSMDYEIFLLSRIKEEHDAGSDTRESVALGLQRSGRIISAAALLLAVVFAAFVSSGVTSIKMMGLGVAFAILMDATVIRGLLVPAFMRVAGQWNWWAPAPLRRVHQRFGLSD